MNLYTWIIMLKKNLFYKSIQFGYDQNSDFYKFTSVMVRICAEDLPRRFLLGN